VGQDRYPKDVLLLMSVEDFYFRGESDLTNELNLRRVETKGQLVGIASPQLR
jgi:hypothetical protein